MTSQLEREYQLKKLETHLTDVSSDVDEWVALLRHSLKAMEQQAAAAAAAAAAAVESDDQEL